MTRRSFDECHFFTTRIVQSRAAFSFVLQGVMFATILWSTSCFLACSTLLSTTWLTLELFIAVLFHSQLFKININIIRTWSPGIKTFIDHWRAVTQSSAPSVKWKQWLDDAWILAQHYRRRPVIVTTLSARLATLTFLHPSNPIHVNLKPSFC